MAIHYIQIAAVPKARHFATGAAKSLKTWCSNQIRPNPEK